jgi:hypothetical protein
LVLLSLNRDAELTANLCGSPSRRLGGNIGSPYAGLRGRLVCGGRSKPITYTLESVLLSAYFGARFSHLLRSRVDRGDRRLRSRLSRYVDIVETELGRPYIGNVDINGFAFNAGSNFNRVRSAGASLKKLPPVELRLGGSPVNFSPNLVDLRLNSLALLGPQCAVRRLHGQLANTLGALLNRVKPAFGSLSEADTCLNVALRRLKTPNSSSKVFRDRQTGGVVRSLVYSISGG